MRGLTVSQLIASAMVLLPSEALDVEISSLRIRPLAVSSHGNRFLELRGSLLWCCISRCPTIVCPPQLRPAATTITSTTAITSTTTITSSIATLATPLLQSTPPAPPTPPTTAITSTTTITSSIATIATTILHANVATSRIYIGRNRLFLLLKQSTTVAFLRNEKPS